MRAELAEADEIISADMRIRPTSKPPLAIEAPRERQAWPFIARTRPGARTTLKGTTPGAAYSSSTVPRLGVPGAHEP